MKKMTLGSSQEEKDKLSLRMAEVKYVRYIDCEECRKNGN